MTNITRRSGALLQPAERELLLLVVEMVLLKSRLPTPLLLVVVEMAMLQAIKKRIRLDNIVSIISTHAVNGRLSVERIAKFRDVARKMGWKAGSVQKLLDQKICCCGIATCLLLPFAPDAVLGYHFCTKTGLRLSASWWRGTTSIAATRLGQAPPIFV